MLDSKAREIALHVVASRAVGTPAEAAAQILAGFAVLEAGGSALVVWPASLSPLEKEAALEAELARIRQANTALAEFWGRSTQPGSGGYPEYPSTGSLESTSDAPEQEVEGLPALRGEAAQADHLSGLQPDREANDASL